MPKTLTDQLDEMERRLRHQARLFSMGDGPDVLPPDQVALLKKARQLLEALTRVQPQAKGVLVIEDIEQALAPMEGMDG